MSEKTTLRAWTFFKNGIRISGAHEFTPPELAIQIGNIRTGAQDGSTPTDDGIEPMTAQIKFYGLDTDMLSSFGFISGSRPRFMAYEGYIAPGRVTGSTIEMEGIVSKITPDARGNSGQSENSMTAEIAVTYFKRSYEGVELIEIDTERLMRRVNGVDALSTLASKVRI